MFDVIDFSDVIKQLEERGSNRRLLLGNGFSIACRPKIFTYSSLFRAVRERAGEFLDAAFEILNTHDFEAVIRFLEQSAVFNKRFEFGSNDFASQSENAANNLKGLLVEAIAERHPVRPSDIDDSEYEACAKFLSNFISRQGNGRVYTLNYDLLLYWTLMHDYTKLEEGENLLHINDGFRGPDDPNADYVEWDFTDVSQQKIFYIHGALHLFQGFDRLSKATWIRTGKPLIDQISHALERKKYPLFVTEGTSAQKQWKIMRNGYLSRTLRSLYSALDRNRSALVTYGWSLAENDTHILEVIAKSQLPALYVGVFGELESAANQEMLAQVEFLKEMRRDFRHSKELEIVFYSSASADVWGKAS